MSAAYIFRVDKKELSTYDNFFMKLLRHTGKDRLPPEIQPIAYSAPGFQGSSITGLRLMDLAKMDEATDVKIFFVVRKGGNNSDYLAGWIQNMKLTFYSFGTDDPIDYLTGLSKIENANGSRSTMAASITRLPYWTVILRDPKKDNLEFAAVVPPTHKLTRKEVVPHTWDENDDGKRPATVYLPAGSSLTVLTTVEKSIPRPRFR